MAAWQTHTSSTKGLLLDSEENRFQLEKSMKTGDKRAEEDQMAAKEFNSQNVRCERKANLINEDIGHDESQVLDV
ncbi:hypothetical protein CEXT_464901 [Caerostris extrusa]|uniref:Uncharacterized protein n=1 Tax=Caerostris extrusa TaxID=172846 RepID=A0AAV4XP96_CAEEX|nr:hypothetical protein CEXT_464901 [Caerostris extrusa]